MSTAEGIAQYVALKFEQISYGNHKSLVYYIDVARGLKLLMDKLRTDLNESTYKSYQTFLSFMDDYPRFVHSNLTYNQIKENMGKFKSWFKAQPSRIYHPILILWTFFSLLHTYLHILQLFN